LYDELYAAWRLETENSELSSFPQDFYARIAEYLQRLKAENQVQEKSMKANLLQHEMMNATRLTQEILSARYRKLLKMLAKGRKIPRDFLTNEESTLYSSVAPSTEEFNRFSENILQGKLMKLEAKVAVDENPPVHRRVTLRFLKAVPSIIGSDMKSYGPFLVEDVASVPVENAKILVKQGLAKTVAVE
jgi:DNA replication initiation complex subunit (GINS family)